MQVIATEKGFVLIDSISDLKKVAGDLNGMLECAQPSQDNKPPFLYCTYDDNIEPAKIEQLLTDLKQKGV